MDMYLNTYNVRTKFEQKLSNHIQDSTISEKQDGRQSAIFERIVKQIVMDTYPNMYMYVPSLNEN